jgi:HTH-type transcriptional regulator/antitoxin HigA
MNNTRKHTGEADELELLAVLVEKYEDEHCHIPSPDPIDFLKYVMEEKDLKQ